MSFEEFLAKREAERAAAPPRVTWRKVSDLTGGGWSGLGPGGALVWVGPPSPLGFYEYGRVVDGKRAARGTETSLMEAKRAAAALLA